MGKTFGLQTVDWEERVDVVRLRRERLARVKSLLADSEIGALLCFDMSNIRYITATHIGTWAMDKLARFCLLPQDDDPVMWDFGSAARHHEIYCPWLEGRSPAGISTMRGAMSPESGRAEDVAEKIRPGVMTDEVVSVWPKAQEFGFPNEEAAFALQFGHGVGLSIWEKPIISRLVSLDHPEVIQEGMVFALETFWPATDGWSAARIEEQLVVTADGAEVITRFPAEDLMIAGRDHYYTAHGQLAGIREIESSRNTIKD